MALKKPKAKKPIPAAPHYTTYPGGGGGPTTPAQPPMNNNPPYQTNYGAYLYMEQHSPKPKVHKTPPNVKPHKVPTTHIHVHNPIIKVKRITEHPAATLPFTAVMGSSSATPHLHHYGSIASQRARR